MYGRCSCDGPCQDSRLDHLQICRTHIISVSFQATLERTRSHSPVCHAPVPHVRKGFGAPPQPPQQLHTMAPVPRVPASTEIEGPSVSSRVGRTMGRCRCRRCSYGLLAAAAINVQHSMQAASDRRVSLRRLSRGLRQLCFSSNTTACHHLGNCSMERHSCACRRVWWRAAAPKRMLTSMYHFVQRQLSGE